MIIQTINEIKDKDILLDTAGDKWEVMSCCFEGVFLRKCPKGKINYLPWFIIKKYLKEITRK